MAEISGIEWTDSTFNAWLGCLKVSPGCANCYAELLVDGRFKRDAFGPGAKRKKTGPRTWYQPAKWDNLGFFECQACGWRGAPDPGVDAPYVCDRCDQAGQMRLTRRRVFCSSLADVFEDNPAQPELDAWRADLWKVIASTPDLDWLILTKRPENIERMLPEAEGEFPIPFIPPNVYLGTSAENQEQFDRRWPVLESLARSWNAPGIWLSAEPLIGPLDLTGWLRSEEFDGKWLRPIQWVIAGGESGANARPCFPHWIRDLRDQCQADFVPFFFKQWGRWKPVDSFHKGRRDRMSFFADEDGGFTPFVPVGRKKAGAELDGQKQHEFPDFLKAESWRV